MYKNMLPLGSIVRIHGNEAKLLICGRNMLQPSNGKIFDYTACGYPEGFSSTENLLVFNRDQIEEVVFLGSLEPEEIEFREEVLNHIQKMEFTNGKVNITWDD